MRKITTIFSFIFLLFILMSCVSGASALEILNKTNIEFRNDDSYSLVTTHITLPTTSALNKDAILEWESSDPSIIDSFGTVNRPDETKDVTLTLRVTLNNETVQKYFYLTVAGSNLNYTVTFKVFDDVYNQQTIRSGYFLSLFNNPNIEGYVFIGWFVSPELEVEFDFSNPVTNNLIIEAKFEQLEMSSYQVEIYYENIEDDLYQLTDTLSFNVEVGTVIDYNDMLEVAGFQVDFELSILTGTVLKDSVLALKVYYQRLVYEINYFSDGVELASSDLKYDAPLTPIADPTKTNYEFLGWGVTVSAITPYDFDNKTVKNAMNFYAIWTFAQLYTGYYEGLNGITDVQFKSTLRGIISNYVGVTYGAARYALDDTDRDPNNPNNVILVYNRASVSGVWDGGVTWNREHVFPQSYLGASASNEVINIAADMHNLKPANPSINTSRGNKAFAPGSGTHGAVVGGYYPGDADKGDIARIILYMHVRWNLIISPSTIGDINTFLRWHIEDPVDAFEANRNEVIHQVQGNRNPFIDHPELADRIWGSITLEASNHEYIQVDIDFNDYFVKAEITIYLIDYSMFKKENKFLA
jgi:endonuclease I